VLDADADELIWHALDLDAQRAREAAEVEKRQKTPSR